MLEMATGPNYHLHPAMRYLRRGIRRERQLLLGLAAVLLLGGGGLCWHFFRRESALAMLGLAAALLGLRLAWGVWRQPKPGGHRLFKLLEHQPEKIVWVYSVSTQLMPFGLHLWDSGTMYFKLSDGGEIDVSLPARQLKMVSKFLNRILPHASFGYSEERRQQFEADPALLRK